MTVSVVLNGCSMLIDLVESAGFDNMVKIEIALVLGVHNLLIGLLNLTGLALMSQHSTTFLAPEFLLLLFTLPHFFLSLAVEEGLWLVLVMVEI